MYVHDVMACSFPQWYLDFHEITIPSVCLPLSADFVAYLREDGLILPKEAIPSSDAIVSNRKRSSSSSSSDWSDSDDENDDETEIPSFPELAELVTKSIRELGGAVFAKLNWSSPKDASWIGLNRSLLCHTFGDVVQVLKASTFVQHDLGDPFFHCVDKRDVDCSVSYYLVLRRWIDVNPATEFRCFVRNRRLIAISQRDMTTHYAHMTGENEEIKGDLNKFMTLKLKRFSSDSYVFDVFSTDSGCITLLDFNPFGGATDALLFNWTELTSDDDDSSEETQIRLVASGQEMKVPEYASYQLPLDMVDLMTGSDPSKLIDLLKMKTTRGRAVGNVSDSEAEEEPS